MNRFYSCLYPVLALAILAPRAHAEKEVVVRRVDTDTPRHVFVHKDDGIIEKEKVTFLGVETAPMQRALAAQLGLPKDTGLVVVNVMEKSPAADVLKEDDVLLRLDDQILIDTHQLGVLVRGKKEGDEVKLTFVRGGKEMTVKAKLAVHDVPRMADAFFYQNVERGGPAFQSLLPPEAREGLAWQYRLPGMGSDDAQDVLHMIERERGNFMTGPGVHILGRADRGSTIVDLPKSNISYSDEEGSIEIKVDDGKRQLTVKDPKGVVAFNGPINTEEERKKLPAEVTKRLEKLETDTFNFEVGGDFKSEVVPLPPEPARTKISRALDADPAAPDRANSAPF